MHRTDRLRDRSDRVIQPEEPLNIDNEMQKLEQKFGKELTKEFKVYIDKNMEDYKYLNQFKV